MCLETPSSSKLEGVYKPHWALGGLKERTLPTLELLAVQLALKCFLTIFSDVLMKDDSFSDINFFL